MMGKEFCERCGTWVRLPDSSRRREKPVGRIRGEVVAVPVVYCSLQCERKDAPTT